MFGPEIHSVGKRTLDVEKPSKDRWSDTAGFSPDFLLLEI